MNVYRSFGNLMESWVADAGQYSEAACLGYNEDLPTPSSLRPGSVDSGVETASSVMSFPASPSVFTDNAGRGASGLTPASTPQSPALSSPVASSSSSSSSPLLGPSGALRVSVDEMLMRRPRASSGPTRHPSWVARSQRSRSFALKRSANAPEPTTQTSELRRRPIPQADRTRSQVKLSTQGLSPGLCYLEHLCQTLEEFARQQMHGRASQMEKDPNVEVDQAAAACEKDSESAEGELPFCLKDTERAEQSEAQPGRGPPRTHFRQRSASDTNVSTLYRRRLNADCRGQHLSTDDLLEMDEDEKQGSEKKETNKKSPWKLKFGSFAKVQLSVADTNRQKKQSSEGNGTRRRLSQIFRRRKTPPV
ncbi:uncharacterized protein AB9W97_004693 [Spinachia spinachia]